MMKFIAGSLVVVGALAVPIERALSQPLTLTMDPEFLASDWSAARRAFSRAMNIVEADTHFGDPSAGCESDEVSVQITGIKGDFCTSQCSLLKHCPTDVPAGVTATPTCALQDPGANKKYCALICDPSASVHACGKATCKVISGTGICTYDDMAEPEVFVNTLTIEQPLEEVGKLPTNSRCQILCPNCTTVPCECDSCWPGRSLDTTPDKTCNCFAQLGFCNEGEKPVYTPGKECPSCWPSENKACDCFASIGFCEPPPVLPTTSRCSTLCPDCHSPSCKCDACWPGYNLSHTPDHTCQCFAELGFCKDGEEPVYTPGKDCPSCWPSENTACDCFAAIGFCAK